MNLDNPVVFVHGNRGKPQDWSHFIQYFRENGYKEEYLWRIKFSNKKTHERQAGELEDFISEKLSKIDVDTVSIVSHSLGVTVSRYWMLKYDRLDSVSVFVGLAGANHGVSICPPKEVASLLPEDHSYKPCQFLSKNGMGEAPISKLNSESETPGDVKYYTIRGSRDQYFRYCKDSPRLEGAVENAIVDTDHMGILESEYAIEKTFEWVTESRQSEQPLSVKPRS
jgi:triacylglycerol lipase